MGHPMRQTHGEGSITIAGRQVHFRTAWGGHAFKEILHRRRKNFLAKQARRRNRTKK